jgi:glycosyltransferase involved in cell wall biosynthesis
MGRTDLLYITPVVPRESGNGLAMRAYHVLEALSSKYRVHLLTAGLRPGDTQGEIRPPEFCEAAAFLPARPRRDLRLALRWLAYRRSPDLFCRLFSEPPEWATVTGKRIRAASRIFSRRDFDVIHVFRLYMSPFASPFLREPFAGTCQVDIDDIESVTRRDLSDLYRLNGNGKMASSLAREAAIYASMEGRILPRFDRVFVCSDTDREKISRMYQCADVAVLPNVVRIPAERPPARARETFSFLFVGTLGYYPNYDGIVRFCEKILPLLRENTKKSFSIKVAGVGMTDELAARLSAAREVEVLGYVEDLAPVYTACDAVIVPVRAGGGTRIKVLEAFSYGRPVVSTSAGIAGIGAVDGRHVLAGNTPEEFALCCLKIMNEKETYGMLAEKAFALVRDRYSPEILTNIL